MKPITKHLVKSVFILAMVTVASFGIRHVRFSVHKARTVESPIIAETESGLDLTDLNRVVDELDQRKDFSSEWDNETPSEDNSELNPEQNKDIKAVSRAKLSKGSKGLEKISMGDNDNLYITKEGELWYVSKQPDGSVTKVQVQIDQTTGEMNIVDIAGGKSKGSQGLEKISMSDYEDLYITGEGDLWYVSEQPDGSTVKNQALIDETTGEMVLIDKGDGSK
jgi:hypothetical protein